MDKGIRLSQDEERSKQPARTCSHVRQQEQRCPRLPARQVILGTTLLVCLCKREAARQLVHSTRAGMISTSTAQLDPCSSSSSRVDRSHRLMSLAEVSSCRSQRLRRPFTSKSRRTSHSRVTAAIGPLLSSVPVDPRQVAAGAAGAEIALLLQPGLIT